jgi:hypothetical protein
VPKLPPSFAIIAAATLVYAATFVTDLRGNRFHRRHAALTHRPA